MAQMNIDKLLKRNPVQANPPSEPSDVSFPTEDEAVIVNGIDLSYIDSLTSDFAETQKKFSQEIIGHKMKNEDPAPTLKQINNESDVVQIPIDSLSPMPNNPFKIYEGEKLDELCQSVKENGILNPVLVMQIENGYQIIAGHNRVNAAKIIGFETVSCIIKSVTFDEAIILAVDSNIQRETALPSEKAYSYKMKMEALKRQGKASNLIASQIETRTRTDEILAAQSNDSRSQIQKYIRLTELIPELLKMVDNDIIAIGVGVELSFIDKDTQELIFNVLDGSKEYAVDIKKAQAIKDDSECNKLTLQQIMQILKIRKQERDPKITKPSQKIRSLFPPGTKAKTIEDTIIELLKEHFGIGEENDNA